MAHCWWEPYNLLLRTLFGVRFRDAQCGFKAVRADVAAALLPHVEDDGWFFDTELLLLAEHNGLRIHEVPVDWVDDPDSRVRIVPTALADLRGMVRVGAQFLRRRGRIDGLPDRRLTAVGPAAMMAACTTTGSWSRSASRAS